MDKKLQKTKPYILITNDDSIDSPLLAILIKALKEHNDLIIVAPAKEQSWKGKSMTRRGILDTKRISIENSDCWAIDGTPADCANIGIHNIAKKKPDFIISGVNIGKNIGIGFSLASGTIGACLESNIAGIPAIALSQEFFPEDFKFWDANRNFSESTKNLVLPRLATSIQKVWQYIQNLEIDGPLTWNVNFPKKYASNEQILIKNTVLSNAYYNDCFKLRGNDYEFALASIRIDENENSDVSALEHGAISVTQLDIRVLGQQLIS